MIIYILQFYNDLTLSLLISSENKKSPLLGFTLHHNCKGYMATFQLFWRKTLGAPSCIISGMKVVPLTFRKLAGQLPYKKQSKILYEIQTHSHLTNEKEISKPLKEVSNKHSCMDRRNFHTPRP